MIGNEKRQGEHIRALVFWHLISQSTVPETQILLPRMRDLVSWNAPSILYSKSSHHSMA